MSKNRKNTIFIPSKVVTDISQETWKPDQHYCVYDENRNKVAVIVKKWGVYDNDKILNKVNDYFSAVKKHINIDNVWLKKFDGNSINDFDEFIESLVKKEFVWYIIIAWTDLPITKEDNGLNSLDVLTINEKYWYIGRERVGSDVDKCQDVAISFLPDSMNMSDQEKEEFIISMFEKYTSYHNDPESIYNKFSKNVLMIEDIDFTSYQNTWYRSIHFYNSTILKNNQYDQIRFEVEKKPIMLLYNVHWAPTILWLWLFESNKTDDWSKTYSNNESDVLAWYNKHGEVSLFIDVMAACYNDILANKNKGFCCRPQTRMKVWVWTHFQVLWDPYHNSFERWLFKEKVVWKAIRRTRHNQNTIYWDILWTTP